MRPNASDLTRELNEMGIRRGPILDAIRYVPRPAFVPDENKPYAWENRPLGIWSGQTISQPYTVASMLELADVTAGGRVLEIGCGSGYAAAVIAYVVGDMGTVTAVEIDPVLATKAAKRLRKIGLAKVLVIQGDGRKGYPARAPYDSIIVSAQAPDVPEELPAQLAEGGVLVMPVEEHGGAIMTRMVRRGDGFITTRHGSFSFVPLV